MKIITLAHQKGGVGKTTLTLNLAFCFRQIGLNVGIIDNDLQGSINNIADIIDGIDIIKLELLKDCGKDIVLIDTPPYLNTDLESLFALSDCILIPTKAGYFDILAIKATIALILKAQAKKPGLKAGIVLNMIKPNAAITARIKELLESHQISTFETLITDRVSYASSPITNGIFGSNDEKAQKEIIALTNEILDLINV